MKKKNKKYLWIGLGILILTAVLYLSLTNNKQTTISLPFSSHGSYQFFLSNQTEYVNDLSGESLCVFILQSTGNQSTYCYNRENIDMQTVLDSNCRIILPDVWRCSLNYQNDNPVFIQLSQAGSYYYIIKK